MNSFQAAFVLPNRKLEGIIPASSCHNGQGCYKLFSGFAKDESGATAIEYGLIAALIALAIIVGASIRQTTTVVQNIAEKLK